MSAVPRKLTLAQVMPHQGHMLLLDELLDCNAEQVSCALTIRRESLFCDGVNGVPGWVGIEYMAQTACAYAGALDVIAGSAPRICLLLGSRRYECDVPFFALGSRLRVVATLELLDDNDLAVFDCAIHARAEDGERIIARGDIKAYRPRDLAAVVRGERI